MRTLVRFPRTQTNRLANDDIVPDDCDCIVYARGLYILQKSRVTYVCSVKRLLVQRYRRENENSFF